LLGAREAPGPADQVALHLVASLLQQDGHLSISLNALGKHRHAKPMCEADHGAHNCQRSLALTQRGNKGSIDLDSVQRKSLEV
jgi:hypothetical protein